MSQKLARNSLMNMISDFFSESKKIFVIGNYGKGNIGDESMLLVLSQMLYAQGITEIYVPSINPLFLKKINNLVEPVSINHSPMKMMQSDTIIVGGGTLFSQQAGIFIKLSLLLCLIFKIFNKKLYFIGFGVSNDTPNLLKPLLKLSLSLADGIILRDSLSEIYLRNWGISKVKILPDLAYGLVLNHKQDRAFLPELDDGTKKIGVVLSSSIDEISYEKVLQSFPLMFDNLISEMNKNVILLFFTFSPGIYGMKSDKILNQKITSKMENRNRTQIIPYYPPTETIDLFTKLDLIIGMRYHSKIFSDITNTPLIGISVHDKDIAFHIEKKYPVFLFTELLEKREIRNGLTKCVMSQLNKN